MGRFNSVVKDVMKHGRRKQVYCSPYMKKEMFKMNNPCESPDHYFCDKCGWCVTCGECTCKQDIKQKNNEVKE